MKKEHSVAIPIKKGLWIKDGEDAVLLGSQCVNCKEIVFPKKENNFCPQCHKKGLTEIKLSSEGIIHAFTVVNQQPAGGFYKGPVPYAYGIVRLPEGVNIMTLYTACDWEEMKIGQKSEMVIEKLYEEDGQEVLTFKFAPVFTNGKALNSEGEFI